MRALLKVVVMGGAVIGMIGIFIGMVNIDLVKAIMSAKTYNIIVILSAICCLIISVNIVLRMMPPRCDPAWHGRFPGSFRSRDDGEPPPSREA
jgi:hypothetical protein